MGLEVLDGESSNTCISWEGLLTINLNNCKRKNKSIEFMMGKVDNLTFVAWIGDSCGCYAFLLSLVLVFVWLDIAFIMHC